jgi:hypothetical protein
MPQPFNENSPTAKTVAQVRAEKIEKEISAKRKRDRENLREIKRMKQVKIEKMNVLVGDRTQNTKSKKKHARQKMRIDKELSMHAHSVNENGKYWYESVEMTLAVITHARMIIASRQERTHDAYEHVWPSEIRKAEHAPEGGE